MCLISTSNSIVFVSGGTKNFCPRGPDAVHPSYATVPNPRKVCTCLFPLVTGISFLVQSNEMREADYIFVIYDRDLAMVRLILKDDGPMKEKIGYYCLPFTSIAEG